VQGGAPALRGTRMPVDAIVDNSDHGETLLKRFSFVAEI
jgi:uncharacterized protein (DUF433 family)